MQIIKNTHQDKFIEKVRIESLYDIMVAARAIKNHLGDSFVQSCDEDEFFDLYDNLCVSLSRYDAITDLGEKK